MNVHRYLLPLLASWIAVGCKAPKTFDKIIRNGMIYDGQGGAPYRADIGINQDTIAEIGNLGSASSKEVTDAKGKAVSPGFINMLSWADESLIYDGRSQSDIRQGVTLEVFGEGRSMGPLNPAMKADMQNHQGDIRFEVGWNTLGGYLNFLQKKGVSCNVASFLGATTVRMNVIGDADRLPAPAEMLKMQQLVKQAMQEGAMGIGSALIYPPGYFAKTEELVALCKVASAYGGTYISHIRNEGRRVNEAVSELITIARQAHIHAEIYHLKVAGKDNWYKMDSVISQIEQARSEGLNITANMYTYLAGATSLTASFPPTLQDGGFGKLWQRLHDPAIRKAMAKAMDSNPSTWDNLYAGAGSPDKVLLLGFRQDSLKKYQGMTLAAIAKLRNRSPEETAMDLIVQDSTGVNAAYFHINDANVKKEIALPWVSFGSDEESLAPEGIFLKTNCHPRAYGNFARLLGKYTRDDGVISLQEAIRKLSLLPATNLNIKKRGALLKGYYADVVIFDPATVQDHASFEKPHQLANGVSDVFVNGAQVIRQGKLTDAKPGRFVKGPGYGMK